MKPPVEVQRRMVAHWIASGLSPENAERLMARVLEALPDEEEDDEQAGAA